MLLFYKLNSLIYKNIFANNPVKIIKIEIFYLYKLINNIIIILIYVNKKCYHQKMKLIN
jgi:hypothetical protein